MADFPSKSDPEQEHRRRLLSAARNGQATAMAELANEYNVRVYSEAERSALDYAAVRQVGKPVSRRQLGEWIQIDNTTMSDDADLPIDRFF
jgi:hypothetical protein